MNTNQLFAGVVSRYFRSGVPERAMSATDLIEKTPSTTQELFTASLHLSDAELSFALSYVDFYLTVHDKVLPEQLYWSVKYAITVASLALAMNSGVQLSPVESGQVVEYSFASIREDFQPDPADYDINLIRGAVILHDLPYQYRDLDPRSSESEEIGAAWETVCAHWGHLSQQPASLILYFLRNLKDGGAIALSGGLL